MYGYMIGVDTGQFGIQASAQTDVLWTGGVLIVVLLVAGFVVLFIRKRWDPRQSGGDAGGGMTMEQIEAMHQAGHISDEEFAVMRRRLLKIPPAKEESKSNFSRSDSIMDDSEEGRRPTPDTPEATDDL